MHNSTKAYVRVKLKLHTFSTSVPPEVSNQVYDPVAFSGGKNQQYPFDWTLGELQNYYGRIFQEIIPACAETRSLDANMP